MLLFEDKKGTFKASTYMVFRDNEPQDAYQAILVLDFALKELGLNEQGKRIVEARLNHFKRIVKAMHNPH